MSSLSWTYLMLWIQHKCRRKAQKGFRKVWLKPLGKKRLLGPRKFQVE